MPTDGPLQCGHNMIKVQTAVYQLYEDKYKAGFQIVAGQRFFQF